ncbi:MAG: DMT family transporter [Hyphomicrobiaceae bacterium]
MTTASDAGVALSPIRPQRPLRGILYLCIGVVLFSLHDVGVKWVSGSYPLAEVLTIRSATALPFFLLLVHLDPGLTALAPPKIGLIMLRAVLLLIGYLSYYLGFAAMPFTDAVALYMSVPLIIVVLSGPFLGERIGWLSWLAVIVGFLGVIVMLRPGSGVFEPAALLILFCALLYSIGMVMTRGLSGSAPASVMAFYNTVFFLGAAIGIGIVQTVWGFAEATHPSIAFLTRPWVWPSALDLATMIGCGVVAFGGIAGLTYGYREADANLVASFEYTALVWAPIWGFLIWAEVPGPATIAGAGLIVGAGLAALFAGRAGRAV